MELDCFPEAHGSTSRPSMQLAGEGVQTLRGIQIPPNSKRLKAAYLRAIAKELGISPKASAL